MNVEFKNVTPPAKEATEIMVGRERFGTVQPMEYSTGQGSYMARVEIFDDTEGRAYGYGDTKEEAIVAAIENGRRDARRLLDGLDDFERKLKS